MISLENALPKKKWGYIGDYYRAKALYEIGGGVPGHRCYYTETVR